MALGKDHVHLSYLSTHKMTKNDIQRLSTDQLSQGQEGIPPLVQTSGTCRRLNTNLTVEMIFDTGRRSGRIIGTSPIKEANRPPPNVQVDVAHTSLNETPQKTDNDSKRGGIDRQLQGVGNLENTTTNATLQANGTHSRHQNNSTCKHIELLIHFYLCKILRMEMTPQFPLQHCKIVGQQEMLTKTQLDTIAPAIMDTSETPFDPNNNTSTMDADSTMVRINYAPLDVEKWADISESDKVFMMEKLQEKFIIDFTQDHVKKAIEGKMAARYEITKQVPQAFQEVPNNSFGKANPYKHVSDQNNGIGYVIDLPRKIPVKISSKSCLVCFIIARQIELFKLMHWTSQNELQKQPVLEGGQALKEAEICVQVLGSRSGYIKGLGHGPQPPSSSSKSTHKSHREIELENELKATRELLQSQETRIQHQQSR
ncbi:hypothetical protein AAG906_011510 [Vitis piasezkii]